MAGDLRFPEPEHPIVPTSFSEPVRWTFPMFAVSKWEIHALDNLTDEAAFSEIMRFRMVGSIYASFAGLLPSLTWPTHEGEADAR